MVLERYLYREILEKLFWVIGLLVLILASNRFVGYLADAAAGKIPSGLILKMLSMKMLATLPKLLPAALFISVILALTRLSRDKELVIMAGSGLGDAFLMKTMFKFALVFALLIFSIAGFLSPWAENMVESLKFRAQQESDLNMISAGRFMESSSGDRVVYVEQMSESGDEMHNIFLQIPQGEKYGVLSSESARYIYSEKSGNRYVLFENGYRYLGTPGSADYQVTRYRQYAVMIEQADKARTSGKLETVPTFELLVSDLRGYNAEFQWRLSFVIAGLLLPLLAVVLNGFSVSDKRYLLIIFALLIYFIYSNLLGISRTLLIRDEIAAFPGLWWVHITLLTMITVIFRWRQAVFRKRRQR